MRIDPNSIGSTLIAPPSMSSSGGRTDSFTDLLRGALADVNTSQARTNEYVERIAAGEKIPDAVIANAVTKSDLAFRTIIQIRNKLVDAFNELRQMQI